MKNRNPVRSPPPPEALAMLAEHADCEDVVLPHEPALGEAAYLTF